MVDEFLDRKQAAALLKISERTLDRQSDIPRIRITARRILYRRSDLLAWVDARDQAA
jgi:hypothetical protein